MLISILFDNPLFFVAIVVSLVISLTIHEFAHAFVADKLGDPTAKYLGRVTLNPLAHLDILGTLLLLVAGFGWGKPVPFNPLNLQNPKRDSALIALAGPFSNMLLAFLGTAVFKLFPHELAFLFIYYNLVLCFFNLIPVHPLDGFKVVAGFLRGSLYYQWLHLEQYGIFILMLLVFTNSTGKFIYPFVYYFLKVFGVNPF